MRRKMGTKWVVVLRKYIPPWTEMGIKVEGKKNQRNKYTPTKIPELKKKEEYRTKERQ